MSSRKIKLSDIAGALRKFGRENFHAIDVFADDVLDWDSAGLIPLSSTSAYGHECYRFDDHGESFLLTLFPDKGVLRVQAHEFSTPSLNRAAASTALLGAGLGTAAGIAVSRKGEHFAAGILGMLIGAAIGAGMDSGRNASTPPSPVSGRPHFVFSLAFDQHAGEWKPYSGGLIPWMKKTLLADAS